MSKRQAVRDVQKMSFSNFVSTVKMCKTRRFKVCDDDRCNCRSIICVGLGLEARSLGLRRPRVGSSSKEQNIYKTAIASSRPPHSEHAFLLNTIARTEVAPSPGIFAGAPPQSPPWLKHHTPSRSSPRRAKISTAKPATIRSVTETAYSTSRKECLSETAAV